MEVIREKTKVKTRKPHTCFGCNRTFEKGSSMYSETLKDDAVYTLHICETCNSIMSNHTELLEDVSEGVLYERCIEELCYEMNIDTPELLLIEISK